MQHRLLSRRTPSRMAFSLVEVQISVAVIALITAIAVPHVCRITGQAQTAKEKANAQHISAVAAAAAAAGVVFTDLDSAVMQLTSGDGAVASSGQFAGVRYRMGSLSSAEAEGAKRHLQFTDGQMTVIP